VEQQLGFLEFDGRRVAYASVGDGPPLVLPAWWVSHLVEDWSGAQFRSFVETLAAGRRVIRYDRPGTGLSDRERPPETLTLEYEVSLLAALLDRLELERSALFGISCGGPAAVAYATLFPERVERIALWGSFAAGPVLAPAEKRAALVELVRVHWGLGSRMLADVFGPSATTPVRSAFADMQRVSATASTAADLLELMYAYDVRDVLTAVAVPTLVVHRTGDEAVRVRHGREVAALVPGARLVELAGNEHLPWWGDAAAAIETVAPFFGVAPAARDAAPVGVEELSAREREVLQLVADGLSDAEIADRLVLSPHTVHRHVANIRRKLGLHSRSAAAAHAVRAGLI
jgi:pimeloyl-ACP methyl ester carboxylesterase/DNA-binding CsgD family transcriptional regulator